MDFLKKNMSKTVVEDGNSARVREAEDGWIKAKRAIDNAVYELGEAYFKANKDNKTSEFAAQIETVNAKEREEYIWHQYRLSLDGQRMCDSCNSFITSDSDFCNRCGKAVEPIDFSPILGAVNGVQAANNSNQTLICPQCGKGVVAGAMFCEACGAKIV